MINVELFGLIVRLWKYAVGQVSSGSDSDTVEEEEEVVEGLPGAPYRGFGRCFKCGKCSMQIYWFVMKCAFSSRPSWTLGSWMSFLIKFGSKYAELLFLKLPMYMVVLLENLKLLCDNYTFFRINCPSINWSIPEKSELINKLNLKCFLPVFHSTLLRGNLLRNCRSHHLTVSCQCHPRTLRCHS